MLKKPFREGMLALHAADESRHSQYASLALDRSGRQSLDDLLVKYHVEDQRRKDRQADCGERRPPVDRAELSGEVQQARRNGAIAVTTDESQCEQQVIPPEKELHQGNGHEPVCDHWHSHTVENLVDICSVEYRCLDYGTRDGLEEPGHQKDG